MRDHKVQRSHPKYLSYMFHSDYQAPSLALIHSQVAHLIIQGRLVWKGKHASDFTDKSHFNHQNHSEEVADLYMTGSIDCSLMTKKCSSETAETRYNLSCKTNLPSTLDKKNVIDMISKESH